MPEALRLRIDSVPGRSAPLLDGLELVGRAGDVHLLTGPNGSGKSTVLEIVAGVCRFDGRLEGPLAGTPCAAVWDFNGFAPDLTVRQALRGYVRDTLLDDGFIERAAHLLKAFGLDGAAQLGKLSQGMKQRARLVAAFASQRPLMLLDEPFRPLDGLGRSLLVNEMIAASNRGVLMLVATHREDLLRAIATDTTNLGGQSDETTGATSTVCFEGLDDPAVLHLGEQMTVQITGVGRTLVAGATTIDEHLQVLHRLHANGATVTFASFETGRGSAA